ncbi:MAG: chemotaxis protein CheW [Rhodothermales bacterium]|nr:chemotaxis protein CheW [Rhodothermales bacterium]
MSPHPDDHSNLLQIVSFVIGEEEFGVDILNVQEIIRPVEITRVPNTADFVVGVINLRGKIVPVVDLRKRFGMPRRERDKNTRIVVIEIQDQVVGFMIDMVRQVIRLDRGTIEPPPELATGKGAQYIRGVARLDDRLLTLIDLEVLLRDDTQAVLDSVPQRAAA